MEEKIKQLIKKEFPALLKEHLMSFQNMVVPQHKHNKVDSPAIDSFNINTNNDQGFVFGTSGNRVNIQYDPATNTFLIFESDNNTNPNVPLIIGDFKSINIEAEGVDVGDHTVISFGNPTTSIVNLTATRAETIWSVSPNISSTIWDGTSIRSQWTDGTDTASSVLTGTLQQWTASGDFAIQLPDASLPTPQAGMIAFSSGVFYACADGMTWQVISLI